jgi:hypothetical protein
MVDGAKRTAEAWVSYADFENEVTKHFPREAGLSNIERHDLLAAWYVFAQLTDEDAAAAKAALTKPPDAGVDAVLVGPTGDPVHLVQSKLRSKASHKETRSSIEYLTKWADLLRGAEPSFDQAIAGHRASPTTRKLLREAREAVQDGSPIAFHFVSTGSAPDGLIKDFQTLMELSGEEGSTTFDFRDRTSLLTLYEDYLAGVRPIPEIELPVAERYLADEKVDGIELDMFLVPGDAIRDLVKQFGPRLFARNVRAFQGENAVNAKIIETIRSPEKASRFRYMNNGITVVCDRVRTYEETGARSVRLWNPQFVNGQQTSYMLREAGASAQGVRVVMKVVRIDRDAGHSDYDDVVHDIVQATNWQTKVALPDLRSNDEIQVQLARAMRRLGHYYQRKTTPWGQTLAAANGAPAVTRSQIADAVGGCLFESKPLREVKDNLYVEPVYSEIFDPRKAARSLCCHYLWKAVRRQLEAKGTARERNRAKWLVLFHLYGEVGHALSAHSNAFIEDGASNLGIASIRRPLDKAVKATADAAVAFYRAEADRDEDAHNFFRVDQLEPRFQKFLRRQDSKNRRGRIKSAVRALEKALADAET